MALTFSNLETTGDATDQLSAYTTGSVTPSANRLCLIGIVLSQLAATVDIVSSVTGAGLTWVEVGSAGGVAYNANKRRLQVFRALGSSPSAGALTINLTNAPASLITGAMWSIIMSSADVDTSGTNGSGAVVQSATNSSGSAQTIAPTLASFGDATNNAAVVFGGFNNNSNWTADATPSGWVELGDAIQSNPVLAITSDYLTGEDTAPTVTNSGAANPIAAFALEIKYAAAVVSTLNPAHMMTLGVSW